MEMNTAVRLLQMLPTRRQNATTVADLAARWCEGEPTRSDIRNVQRYLKDFAAEGDDDEDGPALVGVVKGKPRRFYLKQSRVAEWFMTEETALTFSIER